MGFFASTAFRMFNINTKAPEKKEPDQTIEVRVGSGTTLRIFKVDKGILCRDSGYCRRILAADSKHKQEAIALLEFMPINFELYLQWIINPSQPTVYDPDYLPQEPWLSNAATTWLLGRKLQCSDEFDKFALSQFVQSCAFMLYGPWEMIERQASIGSLRRFSDHWTAWNSSFAGPEPNEYSGLLAARDIFAPPIRDPRLYDIEHWYSECGKYMRPRCLHDPILRLERLEEAKKPKPEPPAEWDYDYEDADAVRQFDCVKSTEGCQIEVD
ncbi:hypothetical protein D0Z07_8080 [Hyphodiscus hymeniophilus]|uniref:BTB domain-containing protein n=1 Tax=Hyphodiscus hymeniophilus TaxID=353542 RepID=A0A9P6SNH0_9HELO|nr:hypothetical protein D0Z07_8080 [Hyphodiscus hymeniophilus]